MKKIKVSDKFKNRFKFEPSSEYKNFITITCPDELSFKITSKYVEDKKIPYIIFNSTRQVIIDPIKLIDKLLEDKVLFARYNWEKKTKNNESKS